MRSLYTMACVLALSLTQAQEPFLRVYPMSSVSWFTYGGTIDAEGHYFFLQESADDDVVLSRVSPEGEHLWSKTYPLFTEEGFYGKSIVATDDGILVVGYTMGFGTNSRDGFIMKFDLDGNIVSQQRIDTNGSNALHSLHKGNDGFFASGRSTGAQNYDMLLARIEEDGSMTWSKHYGVSTNPQHWDWARSATQLSDGGYVVVGYGDHIGSTAQAGYVVRTDADGNVMWSRAVSSGVGVEDINTVVEGSNGDIYLGGRSLGFISGDVSAFIVKLNATGQYQWARALQKGIEVIDLHQGPNGGITWLALPQYLPDGAGDYEIGWGQMDATGNTVRMRVYGGTGSDSANNMEPLDGGGWAIFGSTNSHRNGGAGFSPFLLVIDAEGNSDCWEIYPNMAWTTVTAVVTEISSTTQEVFQAFPMTTGTTTVPPSTIDPCCATIANFRIAGGDDAMTWVFTNISSGATSYSWTFGDGTSSTETSPSHTYAQNGNYTVCLTAIGECGSSTTCHEVSISMSAGGDLNTGAMLQAFPVPASDHIVLRSGSSIGAIRMFDLKGRMIKEHNGNQRSEVSISDLPQGVYMIEAIVDQDRVTRTRVVVAH